MRVGTWLISLNSVTSFHEYLYGNTFTVKPDNNSLTYVLTTTHLDATGHCWVAQLAWYNFIIQYRAGKTNFEADALSSIDWNREISIDVVKVILNAVMEGTSLLAEVCAHGVHLCANLLESDPPPQQISVRDQAAVQMYSNLHDIIHLYKNKCLEAAKLAYYKSWEVRTLLRQFPKLRLWDGILYLKMESFRKDCNAMQLVLPKRHQLLAMQGCHNDLGHLGL